MRTQTFEEVRETIARELATGDAFRLLEERIAEIRDIMEVYSVNHRAYEQAVREKDKSLKEPDRPDLQSLADKFGFQFNRTGLVDARSVSTLPIGRSRVTRGMRMQPMEFSELILREPNPYESDSPGNLFVPLTSSSIMTRYIFWKSEHKPSSVPSFDLAKDEVKAVWVAQRAAELAEARAKEIAARVGAETLEDSLETEDDRKLILKPTPFTWLNALMANFQIQLSTVDGLRPIGPDFMERVFSANEGETIVVADAAKDTYYVVRVVSFTPDNKTLLGRFESAPTTTGVRNASSMEANMMIPAWFVNLEKQLGLQRAR
jgi:hypothetical protein